MIELPATGLLLAQDSDMEYVTFIPILIFAVMSLGLLAIGCIAVVLTLGHVRRSRELLHAERLKAFEAGVSWQEPGAETSEMKFMHYAYWIAFWMVVVGCGASFGAAASFTDEIKSVDTSIAVVAWLSAAGASIAAVTCATILMVKSRADPASKQ